MTLLIRPSPPDDAPMADEDAIGEVVDTLLGSEATVGPDFTEDAATDFLDADFGGGWLSCTVSGSCVSSMMAWKSVGQWCDLCSSPYGNESRYGGP